MQDWQQVVGFSDLKDFLIRSRPIEKHKDEVKVVFSFSDSQIWIHDADNLDLKLAVCFVGRHPKVPHGISARAAVLIAFALKQTSPVDFLNRGFQMFGFYAE